jgi:hypothetical protein
MCESLRTHPLNGQDLHAMRWAATGVSLASLGLLVAVPAVVLAGLSAWGGFGFEAPLLALTAVIAGLVASAGALIYFAGLCFCLVTPRRVGAGVTFAAAVGLHVSAVAGTLALAWADLRVMGAVVGALLHVVGLLFFLVSLENVAEALAFHDLEKSADRLFVSVILAGLLHVFWIVFVFSPEKSPALTALAPALAVVDAIALGALAVWFFLLLFRFKQQLNWSFKIRAARNDPARAQV